MRPKRETRQVVYLFGLLSVVSIAFLFGWMGKYLGGVDKFSMPLRRWVWEKSRRGVLECVDASGVRKLVADGVLVEENAFLKRQLNVVGGESRRKALVHVVGGGGGVLRVDAGRAAGLREGMVVVYGDIIVGRLGVVGEWSSEVVTPASPGFRMVGIVRGSVSGSRRADGLVVGRGGKIWITKVLRSDAISEGDVVVSAGVDDGVGGMILGKIVSVSGGDRGGVYQEAQIESLLVDGFGGIREAFVFL